MFCQKCGKELVEMDTFCPYCGTRLTPPPKPESAAIQSAVQEASPDPAKTARPKTNVLAIVGFSLAFFAIAMVILTFLKGELLYLSVPASIAGLVCSIIGRVHCKKLGGSGRGFAITGIVLNAVSLALVILLIVLAILAVFAVFSWLLLLFA